jgi:hypothetical protein
MSKKLSEIFNMPTMDTMTNSSESLKNVVSPEVLDNGKQALTNLEKIDNILKDVNNLESIDADLDDLSVMAIDGYKDLCDLAIQVDSRYSGELFSAAGTMFGHALEAKKAKITKNIKMMELQLKKIVLEQKEKVNNPVAEDNVSIGNAKLLDRNELLKIFNSSKNNGTS